MEDLKFPERYESSCVNIASMLAPAPSVKFSNDTERLQFIDSLRKSPAGAHIKHVIELLIEVSASFKASLYTRANNKGCTVCSFQCHMARRTVNVCSACFRQSHSTE
ncbi:unnamed protein product [Brassica napus]|uniref:(rape) hypothetical protein n=1 Tax=Brassica napus TaxID=3708 RepID=A0A816KF12_BRANA|nr:unnamed protein product [Brassica napus]